MVNGKSWAYATNIAKGKNPQRILIDSDGLAVSPKRTDVVPDIVFVRDDGWSLGCKFENRNVAETMWKYNWEYVVVLGVVVKSDVFTYERWKEIYDKQA